MRADEVVRAIRGAGVGHVTLTSSSVALLARAHVRHDTLTRRESDVLRLVARGKANKQIAQALGIAASTVKSHVGSLLDKLGLGSRTELALYAVRTGLVAPGPDEATDVQLGQSGARPAARFAGSPLASSAWTATTEA
jgi:DNA-binding NarL/FixJ family response regulator